MVERWSMGVDVHTQTVTRVKLCACCDLKQGDASVFEGRRECRFVPMPDTSNGVAGKRCDADDSLSHYCAPVNASFEGCTISLLDHISVYHRCITGDEVIQMTWIFSVWPNTPVGTHNCHLLMVTSSFASHPSHGTRYTVRQFKVVALVYITINTCL